MRYSIPTPSLVALFAAVVVCASLLNGCCRTSPAKPRIHEAGPTAPAGSLDSTKETADGGTARESAELLVTLEPGTDPTEFARAHHLTWVRTLKSDPNMHVLAAASASEARKTISSIFRDSRVRRAELNLPSQNQPFSPQ